MAASITDFEVRPAAIEGLLVIAMKQVTDDRGTIRELFRRSAFAAAGVDVSTFSQINVTETKMGAVRGMHAEEMTKLCAIASGEAVGAWIDLRPQSPTFGVVDRVSMIPGVQILVPSGVANGFQSVSANSQYVYCFDAEWQPSMAGVACTPIDPDLDFGFPIEIDVDDPAQISPKDRDAPTWAQLRPRLLGAEA